jgi:hypothetical protein
MGVEPMVPEGDVNPQAINIARNNAIGTINPEKVNVSGNSGEREKKVCR